MFLPFEPPTGITVKEAWFVGFVAVAIAAIEFAVIGVLAQWSGGLRNLFKIAVNEADKRPKRANNERNPS